MQPLSGPAASAVRQCPRSVAQIPGKIVCGQRAVQRRGFVTQDVQVTRTGKPLISVAGGRSSLGGHTATVFGATGFLGRYIVNRLARSGNTVVIPFREEMAKRFLKVAGDLGRVVFIEYDLRNKDSIEESVRHSDIVYNLVGRDYPTKNFDFNDVHVWGASRIAEAVAKYDVDRFVHVSSHSVSKDSPSEFYRTKAQGEEIVREIYPEATIVRPAPVFGHEDRLLNKLASKLNILTTNWMQERFWPVHAVDIGKALETMALDDSTAGQTYELYGTREYSLADINDIVTREIITKRRHINLPKAVAKPLYGFLNRALFWRVGSADEIEREFIDQTIDPTAKTFADLGIEPSSLEDLAFEYLLPYRSDRYYDLPPRTDREKREEKKYWHVIDNQ